MQLYENWETQAREIHFFNWSGIVLMLALFVLVPILIVFFKRRGQRSGSGEEVKSDPKTVSRRAVYPVENPRKFEKIACAPCVLDIELNPLMTAGIPLTPLNSHGKVYPGIICARLS